MSVEVMCNDQRFVLETVRTAYVLDIHEGGHLQHIYWGKKLAHKCDYNVMSPFVITHSSFEATRGVMGYEFIPWGEMVYSEPTFKASNSAGERGFDWIYEDYKVETVNDQLTELSLCLKEKLGRYRIQITYGVYEEYDIISRRLAVINESEDRLTLEAVRSLQVAFKPGQVSRLTHLAGKWVGEFQVIQETLSEGRKTIDSRRGNTSHQANPWFAVDADATEESGDVWFGHLAYSGNWDIHVEKDAFGFVQLCGGMTDFDFSKVLKTNESFETPVFFLGYSENGFTGMSHLAHRFQRDVILPKAHRDRLRKILYNSWEATYFDVSVDEQKRLAEKAAAIGCELFVIDDGWFGERHSDQAGLGDWYVNQDKFPNGLSELITHVKHLNMAFGIWVEPEMVNRDSQLYHQHPDWVYQFLNKSQTEARHQLVLNLGKKEVRTYIKRWLGDLLAKHDIQFIKWDMNRAFSEPGIVEQSHGVLKQTNMSHEQQQLWMEHVKGLYEVIDHIKNKHPHVVIETCSGGGGRVDLGILQRTDQFWTSDNTDAVDRLSIQYGASFAYNAKAMMCWITDSPNWLNKREVPLTYRCHVAMLGALGVGGNLDQWDEIELAEASKWITYYKKIRGTVQEGTQYRLVSPTMSSRTDYTAIQYVSEDKKHSVLFLFEDGLKYGEQLTLIKLKGLDPEAYYEDQSGFKATGSFFMNAGIQWQLSKQYTSEIYELHKCEK
ncbi:alpha-galactosidase [Bacillus sp. A301a_S52]|nr:alpha-galactosidase [Bacillus sp. A301a_S52]